MLESFSLGGPLSISLNPLLFAIVFLLILQVLLLSQVPILEGDEPASCSPRHIEADYSNVVIVRSCILVGILVFVVLVTIFASFALPRTHSKLLLLLFELELLAFNEWPELVKQMERNKRNQQEKSRHANFSASVLSNLIS